MKDDIEERRNFARGLMHIPIELCKELKSIRGTVGDLSFGGASVNASRTFLRDSLIKVKIDIPRELHPFEGSAKIVWVQKDKAMGIQFIDLPSSEKLKLEKFLMD